MNKGESGLRKSSAHIIKVIFDLSNVTFSAEVHSRLIGLQRSFKVHQKNESEYITSLAQELGDTSMDVSELQAEYLKIHKELYTSFFTFVEKYTNPAENGRLFQLELAKLTYLYQNRAKRIVNIVQSLEAIRESNQPFAA